MPSTPAFTPILPLPSASYRVNRANRPSPRPVRCTIAPQRPQKFDATTPSPSKPSRQKCYRILDDTCPRPPEAPEHRSVPYIGLFLDIFFGFQKIGGMKPTFERYSAPIFSSNYFLSKTYYIQPYSAIVDILKGNSVFPSSTALAVFTDLFGTDVLVGLDGPDHEIARNMIAPAFSSKLFPYYLKIVSKRVDKTWGKVLQDTNEDRNVVKMDPIFREHYLSIVIEMTTGIGPSRASVLRELFSKFQAAFFSPTFGPIYNAAMKAKVEVLKILKEVVISNLENRADIINQLREQGGDNIVKYGMKGMATADIDVLLVSIANSELSTDKRVYAEQNDLIESLARSMMLLWFAGYATAAATSMGSFFELGHRPEILSRLTAEQDALNQDELSYDDINSHMPLLDSYLMEILRLFPAASGLNRRSNTDVELLGRHVPAGSRIFVDIAGAQRDDDLYERPDELILERWRADANGVYAANGGKRPAPLLVFGGPGSAHYCIGAAFAKVIMKATFATLLRKYTFQLDEKQSREYRVIPEITPADGVRVKKFSRRK